MPRVKSRRVIIDTNLLISFLLTKNLSKLDRIIENNDVVLLFSEKLFAEFTEVADRPKFRKYFSMDDKHDLLNTIQNHIEIIETNSSINQCRDKKDNFILDLAVDGMATHLITGDNDLLVLNPFRQIKIVTITDYLLEIN